MQCHPNSQFTVFADDIAYADKPLRAEWNDKEELISAVRHPTMLVQGK